jgi:hypothetical protein
MFRFIRKEKVRTVKEYLEENKGYQAFAKN